MSNRKCKNAECTETTQYSKDYKQQTNNLLTTTY